MHEMTSFSSGIEFEPMSYANDRRWLELDAFLPQDLRLGTQEEQPVEDFWEWEGYRVHVDRCPNPDSSVRLLQLHGVGTNGRHMTMIAGAPMARRGYDTLALDLPGYGMTEAPQDALPTNYDWINLAVDFIAAERAKDPRPIVLFGLSAGGWMSYEVATRTDVAGIISMAFLDQRNPTVRARTALDPISGRMGRTLLGWATATPLRTLHVPIRWVSKMRALINNKLPRTVATSDATGAGASVSLTFLNSYLNPTPVIEPEDFTGCPVMFIQPRDDRWTPRELSAPVLDALTQVRLTEVVLPGGSHYPIEGPALRAMHDAMASFMDDVAAEQ